MLMLITKTEYPMLQESENEEMDVFVIEMNAWVDAGRAAYLPQIAIASLAIF